MQKAALISCIIDIPNDLLFCVTLSLDKAKEGSVLKRLEDAKLRKDYAAKHYSPEQGIFTTYLSYALLSQIGKATCGEHKRSVTTEDGRRVAVSANPLNDCTSLDTPLDGEDKGSSTRGETIPDPAASQAFQQVEDGIYTDELHEVLETAMAENLTEREADVLRRRYYDKKSLRAVGKEIGVQCERVRQIE